MILSKNEKEKVIEYLRLSRKASQNGKYELLDNISSDDKNQAAKIFSKLRNHGIFAYINRNDDLTLKQIKPFNLDYEWNESELPERPEFDKSKCLSKCKACPQLDYCQIRMREWKKHIDLISSRKRIHPEGHLMAQEAIDFMTKAFMGGI